MLQRNHRAWFWVGTSVAIITLAFSAPATAQDAEVARRAAVLASYQGGQITVGDLEDAIANQPPAVRARSTTLAARKAWLDRMIRYELLALEAARRGYAAHPAVIYSGEEQAVFVMQERMAVEPSAIAKSDVAHFFEQHADSYARPHYRRASHIQLASEAEARALIAELKNADSIRFARVATERSTDASTRRQGGQLGYFDTTGKRAQEKASALPQALVDAVFAQKRVGQIAKAPVQHAGGFSVVMFTAEIPALPARRANVEAEIRGQLASEAQSKAIETLLMELRAVRPIQLYEELLPAITLDPLPTSDMPQGFAASPIDPRARPAVVEPDGV